MLQLCVKSNNNRIVSGPPASPVAKRLAYSHTDEQNRASDCSQEQGCNFVCMNVFEREDRLCCSLAERVREFKKPSCLLMCVAAAYLLNAFCVSVRDLAESVENFPARDADVGRVEKNNYFLKTY